MLKLLLGHWKAHRKKPSLLPQNGDIHFEDPSTINPLFEDSDSSISSTNRHTDSKYGENETPSQIENEQNINNIHAVSELIDVSVPKDSVISDATTPKDEKADIEKSKSSLTTETVLDNLQEGESSNNLNSKVEESNLSSLESNDEGVNLAPLVSPAHENVNHAPLEHSSHENVNSDPLESASHEKVNLAPLESSSHEKTTKNFSSKDDIDRSEIESEKKMRIYNQPSTSAISERKSSFDNSTGEKNPAHFTGSKPSGIQNINKQASKQESSTGNKFNKLENNSSSSQIKATSSASSESTEAEKPAKLRARAIEELIKKFQAPITESNNVTNSIVKHEKREQQLSNKLPEAEELKVPINANDSLSSPSNENISKIFKSKNDELPKVKKFTTQSAISNKNNQEIGSTTEAVVTNKNDQKTEPTTQAVVTNKNNQKTEPRTQAVVTNKSNQEIEPISNIFKFPPPPPLEKLQNESSLHGKILKELKVNSPLPTSSKIKENTDNLKESEPGKTRSDSSLERTRTASSHKSIENKEKVETQNKKEAINKIQELSFKEISPSASANKKNLSTELPLERKDKEPKKINETPSVHKSVKESKSAEEKLGIKAKVETKISESETQRTSSSVPVKKGSSVPESKSESSSKVLHKSPSSNAETNVKSSVQKQQSTTSKVSPKQHSSVETENVKSLSEDSGITRGDQISSEATQETPNGNIPEEMTPTSNTSRKNRKDKKSKSNSKKVCKNCRHTHADNASIKRSQYDEYYDGLTGVRHLHRGRHSDSWTSDLSWEEKELLRRLRSKRGTVRSNTPSTRSRISKHRFVDEKYFRRHHNLRRSASDDSTFYGSSLCSCDECWAQYIRDYAYGRASLRGMSPIQEMCTCQTSQNNFLGRRVKFRADTIDEASPSERTTTPAPPSENKQDDTADDKNSQKSSKTKDGDSVLTNPDGIKSKKSKLPEESYRFVTPWELEEWDLLMRKQLLQSRRRRARCMGIMALAMVVFIGLIVAILMVYLRRKVL